MKQAASLRIGTATDAMPIEFFFDGRRITAYAGDTVAAALWANGIRQLRTSPRSGQPRGMFCAMGVCQECVVLIDGQRRPGCQAIVSAQLQVQSVPSGEQA